MTEIYRFAAVTKGLFVNLALQEPFGLTLIEAAAHGLPSVATKNGGPMDIIATLKNGVLVRQRRRSSPACLALLLRSHQVTNHRPLCSQPLFSYLCCIFSSG